MMGMLVLVVEIHNVHFVDGDIAVFLRLLLMLGFVAKFSPPDAV